SGQAAQLKPGAAPARSVAGAGSVDLSDVAPLAAIAITNQSPSGALSTPYVFTWTGVTDATGYVFRFDDGAGYHHERGLTASAVGCSGGGTCTFALANASPAITL